MAWFWLNSAVVQNNLETQQKNRYEKNSLLITPVLAAMVIGSVSIARANIIGSLYEGGGYDWGNGSIVPSGTPNVTFSVANGALDFDSRNNATTGYTIGGWLATGGATILTGSGEAGNTMNNVAVVMSGLVSVTSGETFTVEQDDGLVLSIDGITVLNNPGPNSPTSYSGTYTGPSGDYAFTLDYWEIDGAPAVLSVDLPFAPAPDAGTTAGMLGLGLASLGILRRKLKF